MICTLKVIHYFWLMFRKMKNFRKMCLKNYHLDLDYFIEFIE